ncbi:MAG TPA: sarcosine oxidase subunit delta [Steroidobacteraceae bacterium]|nr:sarcosine oxidase subunit delta [Steroidobacteraceae bacterium]
MLRIECPWCGVRDEIEFRYRGDAGAPRPAGDAPAAEFIAHVYERSNPRDWHAEWWLHVAGCRRLLRVERHTLTHAIRSVVDATDAREEPG